MKQSAVGTRIDWIGPSATGSAVDVSPTPTIGEGSPQATIPANPYLQGVGGGPTPDVSKAPTEDGQIPVGPFTQPAGAATPDVSKTPVNSTP
jgi:hypothetical protein